MPVSVYHFNVVAYSRFLRRLIRGFLTNFNSLHQRQIVLYGIWMLCYDWKRRFVSVPLSTICRAHGYQIRKPYVLRVLTDRPGSSGVG